MKKLITLLAVTAGFAFLAPTTSQAADGHGNNRSFSNNCGTCGTAVYRERVVTGRDRHGHPTFGFRTLSHNCRQNFGHGGPRGSSHGNSNGGHMNGPGAHLDFSGRSNRH